MEEDDGDRLDAGIRHRLGDGIDRGHGKRRPHPALGVDPLGDFKAQVPRHKRFRHLGVKIVEVRTIAATDRDHVAKTRGGDDRRSHAFALGDGVNDGGAAMNEERHAIRRHLGVASLADRIDDAL